MAVLVALLAMVAAAVLPSQTGNAIGATIAPASVPVAPGHLLHVRSDISELPVPPTVPANGICTNPTGCVSAAWGSLGSPGFFWNPHYVLLGAQFAGGVFDGPQVLLVKTDGTTFPNGKAWKCLTCGLTSAQEPGILTSSGAGGHCCGLAYPPPHALPGDRQVLVGNGILECTRPDGGRYLMTDPKCTPANTRIDPIYLGSSPLGAPVSTSPYGNGREWRLSPDGVHLGWDTLLSSGSSLAEFPFEGTLAFDQANQRYDLTHIYLLPQGTPWVVQPGNLLKFDPKQMIGELRDWTSDGRSILGIGSYESDSIDAWATSLATGRSQPLTDHAQYTDPMFMSPNGKWLIAEEIAGSGRNDYISGMEGIPPITDDLPTTAYISEIRNNGNRRFFLPWLVDPAGGTSEQINAGGDPNWNAASEPVWLANSTAVVWAENLACGANPSPHQCPDSKEPGGRNSRVMIARFPTLAPSKAAPPAPIPNTLPSHWAIPYTPGQQLPAASAPIPTGTYTIKGKVRGSATVVIADNSSNTAIQSIQVSYHKYSDDGRNVINGTEGTQNDSTPGNITWTENLALSGQDTGTKVTGPGGFTLGTSVLLNDFEATGTMTTTINGQTFTQPANGT
jgi:hypothetical protein